MTESRRATATRSLCLWEMGGISIAQTAASVTVRAPVHITTWPSFRRFLPRTIALLRSRKPGHPGVTMYDRAH